MCVCVCVCVIVCSRVITCGTEELLLSPFEINHLHAVKVTNTVYLCEMHVVTNIENNEQTTHTV